MAFSDIKKAILDEAQKTAEEYKEFGLKEARKVSDKWEQKAAEKKQKLLETTQRKADQKVLQAQFLIQNQIQDQVLRKKQEIIDRVYDSTLERLTQLSDEQYVDLMEKLIRKLPQQEGVLVSVQGKEDLLDKALKKSNHKHKLSSETVPGGGGFIFRSDKLEINYIFESLLKEAREETILKVVEKLFNSQD